MNNPFEEILKRLDNIEKIITPAFHPDQLPTIEKEEDKQLSLVKISVASQVTGYSVSYLYHLVSAGTIPCVRRGRSLRFDLEELNKWMQQQYVTPKNQEADEKRK